MAITETKQPATIKSYRKNYFCKQQLKKKHRKRQGKIQNSAIKAKCIETENVKVGLYPQGTKEKK